MDDFFVFLEFIIGVLEEFCVDIYGVVVVGVGVGMVEFGNFVGGFVDGDDVFGYDVFFGYGIDYFVVYVVDGFYVGGFDSEFFLFCVVCDGVVDLDFYDFVFYDFGVFFDLDVDGFVEGLGEGFGFGYFEGEDFGGGEGGEGDVGVEGLGYVYCDGGFVGIIIRWLVFVDWDLVLDVVNFGGLVISIVWLVIFFCLIIFSIIVVVLCVFFCFIRFWDVILGLRVLVLIFSL